MEKAGADPAIIKWVREQAAANNVFSSYWAMLENVIVPIQQEHLLFLWVGPQDIRLHVANLAALDI